MKRMRSPELPPEVKRDLQDRQGPVAIAMCSGKDPLTWVQARKILDRISHKHRRDTAYHCAVCRGWHIGSPLKKRKPWRYK
jgi:hypothetical protein